MAARLKLTPAVRTRIADLMRAGGFLGPAAELCGVSRATVWRHYQQDEDFRRAVDQASAEAAHRCLERIAAGADNWLSAACWLSRRYPSEWGWQRAAGRRLAPHAHESWS